MVDRHRAQDHPADSYLGDGQTDHDRPEPGVCAFIPAASAKGAPKAAHPAIEPNNASAQVKTVVTYFVAFCSPTEVIAMSLTAFHARRVRRRSA
ncbi:hypothetical protein ACWFPY_25130 [Nocardia fluminea]